jgi:hypothetical protein
MADRNIPERYNYEITTWVKEGDKSRKRRKKITEDDLKDVDFMIVKSHPENDPKDVTYNTVWGPFEDWHFLEGFLAYDYGDEGSLLPTLKTLGTLSTLGSSDDE